MDTTGLPEEETTELGGKGRVGVSQLKTQSPRPCPYSARWGGGGALEVRKATKAAACKVSSSHGP